MNTCSLIFHALKFTGVVVSVCWQNFIITSIYSKRTLARLTFAQISQVYDCVYKYKSFLIAIYYPYKFNYEVAALSFFFVPTHSTLSQFMSRNISNRRHIFSRPASRKINYSYIHTSATKRIRSLRNDVLNIYFLRVCTNLLHRHCFFLLCSKVVQRFS